MMQLQKLGAGFFWAFWLGCLNLNPMLRANEPSKQAQNISGIQAKEGDSTYLADAKILWPHLAAFLMEHEKQRSSKFVGLFKNLFGVIQNGVLAELLNPYVSTQESLEYLTEHYSRKFSSKAKLLDIRSVHGMSKDKRIKYFWGAFFPVTATALEDSKFKDKDLLYYKFIYALEGAEQRVPLVGFATEVKPHDEMIEIGNEDQTMVSIADDIYGKKPLPKNMKKALAEILNGYDPEL